MQYHPREHLAKWQARATPVLRRMAMHARPINAQDLNLTIALIMKVETGADECFSEANRHHSHHLPTCPAAWRNRAGK